jgi:lysophospholipase L1-like esterase
MRSAALSVCIVAACARNPVPPVPPALLIAPPLEKSAPRAIARVPDPSPPPTPAPPTEPRRYRAVLSVGDSFNGAFGMALEKKLRADGAAVWRDVWVGVDIATFARDKRFGEWLTRANPDLVLINLGANDMDWAAPPRVAPHVRAVVQKIAPRDCYWIAPATWKNDYGLVDTIRANAGHCVFFDSRTVKVERGRDGIHPTVAGGAAWADRFWAFFEETRRQRQ